MILEDILTFSLTPALGCTLVTFFNSRVFNSCEVKKLLVDPNVEMFGTFEVVVLQHLSFMKPVVCLSV